jgi:predicted MFS family arabinose efflux permease
MLNRTLKLYKNSYTGLSREVWLLSGVLLINRSGTMVIPFLSVYLTQVLQFSFIQTGWVMSFFGAGSVLGAFIGGKLTDKIGYYSVQFWSLLLGGVAFILLGQVSSIVGVCVMVFLASTIADAFRPANFAALSIYSRSENRTRAIALQRMAVNLGWAVGPAVGGIIAATLGYDWLFWVDGLTCIGAAIFFRLSLRYKPEDEKAETAETDDTLTPAEAPSILQTSAWKDRAFMVFLAFTFLQGVAFMQLFATLPVFLKEEVLLDEGAIGRLIAMNGLIIAITEMPLIYIIERRFKAWQIIGAGVLLIGLSYLLFNIFGVFLVVAIACMVMMTFGEMLSLPFIANIAMQFAEGKKRGEYMALFSMAFSLAHIAAPNIGLQIAGRFGFAPLWWLVMAISIACWLGFRMIGKAEIGRGESGNGPNFAKATSGKKAEGEEPQAG